MTINEKKQLSAYIKRLVRESLDMPGKRPGFMGINDIELVWHGEWADPELKCDGYVANYHDVEDALVDMAEGEGVDTENDRAFAEYCREHAVEIKSYIRETGKKVEDSFWDDDDDDEIAGINELRRLTESMARNAVSNLLMEKKGKKSSSKYKKGQKKGTDKYSSKGKNVVNKLNRKEVNAAAYYYKLYGAKTKAQKAAARSLGYKKAKGEKNDTGVPYRFSTNERNRLSSLLSNS